MSDEQKRSTDETQAIAEDMAQLMANIVAERDNLAIQLAQANDQISRMAERYETHIETLQGEVGRLQQERDDLTKELQAALRRLGGLPQGVVLNLNEAMERMRTASIMAEQRAKNAEVERDALWQKSSDLAEQLAAFRAHSSSDWLKFTKDLQAAKQAAEQPALPLTRKWGGFYIEDQPFANRVTLIVGGTDSDDPNVILDDIARVSMRREHAVATVKRLLWHLGGIQDKDLARCEGERDTYKVILERVLEGRNA
jgi:chaperonin cofactor prefoldin